MKSSSRLSGKPEKITDNNSLPLTEHSGYEAKSFKGRGIAIEWHTDGSATLCKEFIDYIRRTGDTSYLVPPEPNRIHLVHQPILSQTSEDISSGLPPIYKPMPLPQRRDGTLENV